MTFNIINQILENLKQSYTLHAQRTGQVLPEYWDTFGLQETILLSAVMPADDDPDFHPEPIDHPDPSTLGFKALGANMNKLNKELEKLRAIKHSRIPGAFTGKKILRMYELEDKYFNCNIEWEIRVARREKGGGSKRYQEQESEDTRIQPSASLETGEQEEPTEGDTQKGFTKPKKGQYPAVGSHGPGDLNVEGDWEGPIELFGYGESN